MTYTADDRHYAPATQRNRDAILSVLLDVLPPTGTVLEISSGTGEHAVFFAPRLAPRQWLPSDPNPAAIASITAWQTECPAANLHSAVQVDVCDRLWPVEPPLLIDALPRLNLTEQPIRAIANINMIHIAPWAACLGLMAGAQRILPTGGILYLYGPFKQNGSHTAESNAEFDWSLQAQNPEWGVRNLEDVVEVAHRHDLSLVKTYTMPANNLSVIFKRDSSRVNLAENE